jgi:hypothetical protein
MLSHVSSVTLTNVAAFGLCGSGKGELKVYKAAQTMRFACWAVGQATVYHRERLIKQGKHKCYANTLLMMLCTTEEEVIDINHIKEGISHCRQRCRLRANTRKG